VRVRTPRPATIMAHSIRQSNSSPESRGMMEHILKEVPIKDRVPDQEPQAQHENEVVVQDCEEEVHGLRVLRTG
jgi:hypothetical protein